MNKNTFTLIEMLVVIGIISVLASLLMPGMRRAIDTANELSCSNNLRMLMIGLNTYVLENGDVFPATVGAGNATSQGVYRKILYYIAADGIDFSSYNALLPWSDPGANSVYICPADTHPWANRFWLGGSIPYYNQPKFSDPRIARSFAANSSLAVYRNTTSSYPERWSNYVTSTPAGRPVRLPEVRKPSEALFFMDLWSQWTGNNIITSRTITNYKNNTPTIPAFKVHPHGDLGGLNVGLVDGRSKWVAGTYDEVNPSSDIKTVANNALVVR